MQDDGAPTERDYNVFCFEGLKTLVLFIREKKKKRLTIKNKLLMDN